MGLRGKGIVWDENVLRKSATLWGHMGPLVPPNCSDKKKKQSIKTLLLLWYSESSNTHMTLCGLLDSHISIEMTLKGSFNGDVG